MSAEPVSDELATLRATVARLESERAILDTLYRYAHAIDYGLDEEWLDCFTDDARYYAVFATEGVEQAQGRASTLRADHRGKDELTQFIARHRHAPEHYHKHMLVEPRIEFTDSGASVSSYFLRLDVGEDGVGGYIRTFGRYVDRFVPCDDGRWRLQERRAELEMFQTSK